MSNNVNMDPAANPWGSTGSPPNMFTSASSPDSNTANFGMNSNFYGQSFTNMAGGPMTLDMGKGDMPMLSATSMSSGDGGQSAGEVFMGVQSPQPGGVPAWKWTNMSGRQEQNQR
jgi:hypothetical protein